MSCGHVAFAERYGGHTFRIFFHFFFLMKAKMVTSSHDSRSWDCKKAQDRHDKITRASNSAALNYSAASLEDVLLGDYQQFTLRQPGTFHPKALSNYGSKSEVGLCSEVCLCPFYTFLLLILSNVILDVVIIHINS